MTDEKPREFYHWFEDIDFFPVLRNAIMAYLPKLGIKCYLTLWTGEVDEP